MSWVKSLPDHPIFIKNSPDASISVNDLGLETSELGASQRQSTMCIRGQDLILAVGREVRITAILDSKTAKDIPQASYKTLHTPNIQFEINQISLCAGGKLLAVVGSHELAVIMLPRAAYQTLVASRIDCRSTQIGQYYHGVNGASRIAKVQWHPWGDAGSSLLVMTEDGILREYDVSKDAEEPQQILSFAPPRGQARAYSVDDAASRNFVSFCIGKGKADWGPLTLYALMRGGDVWAMSPFVPSNAVVPASYIPALESFVTAKRDFAQGLSDDGLQLIYDQQYKYVTTLAKQVHPAFSSSSPSGTLHLQPPRTHRYPPVRQGPFLFQPSPHELDGGLDAQATDIAYISYEEEGGSQAENSTDNLGLILLAFGDGKVDVCFDIEKIEGRWEVPQDNSPLQTPSLPSDLPTLTVYETIDLGLVQLMNDYASVEFLSNQLAANDALFHLDPIYSDRVLVSHSLGVHLLDMSKWLKSIVRVLRSSDDELQETLTGADRTEVLHVVNTFSIEQRKTSPIIALSVINNGYVNYTMLALTSDSLLIPTELALRVTDHPVSHTPQVSQDTVSKLRPTLPTESAYVCLLSAEPFQPSGLSRSLSFGMSTSSSSVLGKKPAAQAVVTPDTVRYLGKNVERFRTEIQDMTRSANTVQLRIELQYVELKRQLAKLHEMYTLVGRLKGTTQGSMKNRLEKVTKTQNELLERATKVLQRLMDSFSPQLSDFERQWFDELRRMSTEVAGGTGGLKARTEMLTDQLELLRPGVKEMIEAEAKERERKSQRASLPSGMGTTQQRIIQKRVNDQKAQLEAARLRAEDLAEKMAGIVIV